MLGYQTVRRALGSFLLVWISVVGSMARAEISLKVEGETEWVPGLPAWVVIYVTNDSDSVVLGPEFPLFRLLVPDSYVEAVGATVAWTKVLRHPTLTANEGEGREYVQIPKRGVIRMSFYFNVPKDFPLGRIEVQWKLGARPKGRKDMVAGIQQVVSRNPTSVELEFIGDLYGQRIEEWWFGFECPRVPAKNWNIRNGLDFAAVVSRTLATSKVPDEVFSAYAADLFEPDLQLLQLEAFLAERMLEKAGRLKIDIMSRWPSVGWLVDEIEHGRGIIQRGRKLRKVRLRGAEVTCQ